MCKTDRGLFLPSLQFSVYLLRLCNHTVGKVLHLVGTYACTCSLHATSGFSRSQVPASLSASSQGLSNCRRRLYLTANYSIVPTGCCVYPCTLASMLTYPVACFSYASPQMVKYTKYTTSISIPSRPHTTRDTRPID